jgi:hypothetical protein
VFLGVGVDDDDRVEGAGAPGLGQQRDVVDDDRSRGSSCLQAGALAVDDRVDDRLQPATSRLVAEDEPGDRGAVELPSSVSRWSPSSRTTAASPGLPLATASRASRSASMTTAPSSRRIAETVLLPEATPPVSPTRMVPLPPC